MEENTLICKSILVVNWFCNHYYILVRLLFPSYVVLLFLILVMIAKKILFATFSLAIAMGLVSFSPGTDDADQVGFNLENSVVSAYLEDADAQYSDGIGRSGVSRLNYKVLGSTVSPYLKQVEETCSYPNWAEQPAGVTLPTDGGATVIVSDGPLFSSKLEFAADGDSTSIYNLVPQTVYWYKVLDSSGKEISNGIFKTLGKVRMIKSEKVLNVRDIGGWACDNGHLAYGKIFRSATLDGSESSAGAVDEDDIEIFTNIVGVDAELDLRGTSLGSSPLGSNVAYYNYAINHYMYLMTNTYYSSSSVLTGSYPSKILSCLKLLISNMQNDKSTVVHCTWGADRTGMLMMIVEALCGVSEADLVKEWELTSFNGVLYRKYIDRAELSYYYKSGSSVLKTHAEMRAVFQYLYDNYGGASGASIKEQVTAWLEDTAFSSLSDKGASIIEALRDELIVSDVKSPTIVKDLSKETGNDQYSVTYESTSISSSNTYKFASPTTGVMSESDAFSATGYISCSGYNYLLVNVASENIAAFYDKNKNFISGVQDTSITNTYGDDTVLFENRQYSIPSNAVYVKFNMEKYSGWTAVLSEESLLK